MDESNDTKKAFAEAITGLLVAFDKKPSTVRLRIYFVALRDLSLEEVQAGVVAALRACKFCPKPAELRELVLGTGEDQALLAWNDVLKSQPLGAWKHVDFADKIINATIRHLGGWVDMFDACRDARAESFYQQKFVKAYLAFARQGVSEEATRPLAGLAESTNGRPPVPKRIECQGTRPTLKLHGATRPTLRRIENESDSKNETAT